MKGPTVHLNGTSREALEEQYLNAARALREALDALSEMSPNGRDYYPQGPQAYGEAAKEHEDRTRRVRSVLAEVEELHFATVQS